VLVTDGVCLLSVCGLLVGVDLPQAMTDLTAVDPWPSQTGLHDGRSIMGGPSGLVPPELGAKGVPGLVVGCT
jgi:hypothetical protein